MDDKARKVEVNREPFDYIDDFSFLTPKEKRLVLKTAKHLLKLQKGDADMVVDSGFREKAERDYARVSN